MNWNSCSMQKRDLGKVMEGEGKGEKEGDGGSKLLLNTFHSFHSHLPNNSLREMLFVLILQRRRYLAVQVPGECNFSGQ